MPNVVVHMRDLDGPGRMVGKLIQLGPSKHIFYHEESGNQWHKKLDSPGGIDTVVIDWLKQAGVKEVHHYSLSKRLLYFTPLSSFTGQNSQAIMQSSGGRIRMYLPARHWRMTKHIPYSVPWVTDKVELGPKSPVTVEQGTLW